MNRTKDGIPYKKGMTLYSISAHGNCGISTHSDTYLNGKDRWQTSGSPGCAGVISQCYASDEAAIAEIVAQLDLQIRRLRDERKSWKETLDRYAKEAAA